jgi:hypothetical protein
LAEQHKFLLAALRTCCHVTKTLRSDAWDADWHLNRLFIDIARVLHITDPRQKIAYFKEHKKFLREGFRKHKALIAGSVTKALSKPAFATIVAVELTRNNPSGWALLLKLIVDAKLQQVGKTGPVTSIATTSDVAWFKVLVHQHANKDAEGQLVTIYCSAKSGYALKQEYKDLFNKWWQEESEERKDPSLVAAETAAYHAAAAADLTGDSELMHEDLILDDSEDPLYEQAPVDTGGGATGRRTPASSSSFSYIPQGEQEEEEISRKRAQRNKRQRREEKDKALAAARALILAADDDNDDDNDDDEEEDEE